MLPDMFCRILAFGVFITLILPFVTARGSRRHRDVALRARGDVDIRRRQYYAGSRFTWYDVGLGACGDWSNPTDFIVALNIAQYGDGYPGPNCFKSITIQYGGRTAEAVIMDRCDACPANGGLDFSEGLFEYFSDTAVGVIYGAWWFNDAQTPTTTSTWEPPTSTLAYTPATSSIPVPVTPSTTSSTPVYTPSPSVTTISSTTSSASPTSSNHFNSTGWASGLVAPTGVVSTPDANDPENIIAIYNALAEFSIVLSAADGCREKTDL